MTEFDPFSTDMTRHWCPKSQYYATGDALLTYINNGWSIQQEACFEEFWHGGSRRVVVYYVNLVRDDQHITMPVIDNPVVGQLIARFCPQLRPQISPRPRARQPQWLRSSFN
ncbi:MAG: hypothetical protein CL610_14245 [Anaerolineaceae bacterium]|nr:hypothetical protein [Anaerolineaceae bacterium]